MKRLRQNLRIFVAAWLLSLSASLCAFAPPGCCAMHDNANDPAEACHGDGSGACPMHAASGEKCPLHAAGRPADTSRVVRGLCNGPAASLAALIPVPGVLAQAPSLPFEQGSIGVTFEASHALEVVVAHDSPPPRL